MNACSVLLAIWQKLTATRWQIVQSQIGTFWLRSPRSLDHSRLDERSIAFHDRGDQIGELQDLLEDEAIEPVTKKTVATYASEALDRIAGKHNLWQPTPRRAALKEQS